MTTKRFVRAVIFVVGIVVLSVVTVRWIREQQLMAKQSQLKGKFGQLKLALENYHVVNGVFPSIHSPDNPDPLARSWRLELLPVIERNDMYEQYAADEPWDSPHNREVTKSLDGAPSFYRSPFSDVETSEFSDFLAVDEQDAARLRSEGREVLTVTIDGQSFHIVEIPNSRMHWMNPWEGKRPPADR